MSMCSTCRNARKTWSGELAKEGYIGCNVLFRYGFETKEQLENFLLDNVEAEVVATGWVDLNRVPGAESSDHLVNEQLITKETVRCTLYDEEPLMYLSNK